MRTTMDSGICGDRNVDGFVEWQLVDCGWSYNPSLACGVFGIVIGKGTTWGAPADDRGVATIIDYSNDDPDTCEIATLDFAWHRDAFLEAVADIADRMDHPAPHLMTGAALELWTAIMFDEVA